MSKEDVKTDYMYTGYEIDLCTIDCLMEEVDDYSGVEIDREETAKKFLRFLNSYRYHTIKVTLDWALGKDLYSRLMAHEDVVLELEAALKVELRDVMKAYQEEEVQEEVGD